MAKAKKPKKSKRQRLIEAAMDTLDYGVLEFLAHVSMWLPVGEYADRFSKTKPAEIERAVARLVAEGLAEIEDGACAITPQGKTYRRLELDAAITFFTNETNLDD